VAHGCGCNFLSFPLDPEGPATVLLGKRKPIKVRYHVYAKSLTDGPLSSPTAIYVDPDDL
jgi:hypothetical protein